MSRGNLSVPWFLNQCEKIFFKKLLKKLISLKNAKAVAVHLVIYKHIEDVLKAKQESQRWKQLNKIECNGIW